MVLNAIYRGYWIKEVHKNTNKIFKIPAQPNNSNFPKIAPIPQFSIQI